MRFNCEEVDIDHFQRCLRWRWLLFRDVGALHLGFDACNAIAPTTIAIVADVDATHVATLSSLEDVSDIAVPEHPVPPRVIARMFVSGVGSCYKCLDHGRAEAPVGEVQVVVVPAVANMCRPALVGSNGRRFVVGIELNCVAAAAQLRHREEIACEFGYEQGVVKRDSPGDTFGVDDAQPDSASRVDFDVLAVGNATRATGRAQVSEPARAAEEVVCRATVDAP